METNKRIPKPGEVWTHRGVPRTVVNAYPDAVTFHYDDDDELDACTLDEFVKRYTPPEPTVVDVRYVGVRGRSIGTDLIGTFGYADGAVGRLELLSDGTIRYIDMTEGGAPK